MTIEGKLYQVGDLFTSLKSKKTGVIKEIHTQASGSVRVLLELPSRETRWTSVSAKTLLG
jgi:peroxiredoxin